MWWLTVIALAALASNIHAVEFPELDHVRPDADANTQAKAASDLIFRLIGSRSQEFQVTVDPTLGPKNLDTYRITKSGGNETVKITGTSGVAAAMGFHHYLKYYCNCHVSWEADQLNLPKVLPNVQLKITTNDRYRYYANVCTVSYSFAWWKWPRWQREIDWMALNGINIPLAFTGQEAIWERVFTNLGLRQDEIDAFFAGPAFLAWGRMGNIQGWGGPLSKSWHTKTVDLQKKILKQMRSFGMMPVLPAFAGQVPKGFLRLFPKANVTQLKSWNDFSCNYSCVYMLDPMDPLFRKVGNQFIQEMTAEFGTDHLYNCDTFNENRPSSSNPTYLKEVGKATYAGMKDVDSKAIWVIQGWQFIDSFWGIPQAEAYLTSVPKGRIIVLDLQSELHPQYFRLKSYFGQPFIWCMLQNFGGTLGLYGSFDRVNDGSFQARTMVNSTMIGTGMTPEGINQNYVMFDIASELAWRDKPVNRDEWFARYAHRRYGKNSYDARNAWEHLSKGVVNTDKIPGIGQYVITQRPKFSLEEPIWFEMSDLVTAWDKMVSCIDELGPQLTFQHDLVDVTREILQRLAAGYYTKFVKAWQDKKHPEFKLYAGKFLDALSDMETILASNKAFLLGVWVSESKLWADNDEERQLYTYNSLNQITLWGPRGEIIDYATKQWAGVVSEYYIPRWKLFISKLNGTISKNGTRFDQKAFNKEVFYRAEQPFTFKKSGFPDKPVGNTLQLAEQFHTKWRHAFDQNIFQFFFKLQNRFFRWARERQQQLRTMASQGIQSLSSRQLRFHNISMTFPELLP